MLTLDLKAHELDIVRGILATHLPGCEVRAFGSRVAGKAKPYSDLDLALDADEPLGLSLLARLEEAFEESGLPFRVDIVDWHTASPTFRAQIDRHSVALEVPEVR